MTLMDDLMRVRASEKLQIEKTAAIERRGQAFDALRRQQEDALKALQVGGWWVQLVWILCRGLGGWKWNQTWS